jgi:uncharacterized protein with NRDE domain
MAANRDEFYARPALPLHRWADQPIVAGKDLQAGGTWLGIGTGGRMAALTNYRDVSQNRPTVPSRGEITTGFLNSSASAEQYLQRLALQSHVYNPFNLLVFDGGTLMGFESRHRRAFVVPQGIHALSNADFNTPWPKLIRLRDGMAQHSDVNALFALLSDRRTAADHALPQTGIALDRERALSAEFIYTADYGTRVSSVVAIGRGHADFTERSFDFNGFCGEARERLQWVAHT